MNWYNSPWLYRKKITVDKDKVSGTGTISDYVNYIDLSDLGSDFFDDVKSGGGDIRITTSDGETEVPREVVSCDTTAETGEVHFKGDVDGSTDTDFYIYYGNSGASDYATNATYGAENVWNSNYKVASHDGGKTNSTSNGNDGTVNGATLTTGKIGDAYDFDGSNDYCSVANIPEFNQDFSLSCWIKRGATGTDDYIFGRGTSSSTDSALHCGFRDTNYLTFAFYSDDLNTATTYTDTTNWHHIVFTYDYSTKEKKIYYDNSNVATGTGTGNPDFGTVDLILGNAPFATGNFFNGNIDEVRVSTTLLSSDYISTEYNNQSSPSTFYTIGSQEEEEDLTVITVPPFTLTATLLNPTLQVGPYPEPQADRVSVYINDERIENILVNTLKVSKVLDNKRDQVNFKIRNNGVIVPNFRDVIKIYDGLDLIFSGIVIDVKSENETISSKGVMLEVKGADYGYLLEKRLIGKTYENQSIHDIIADMLSTNAPTGFNADNAQVGIEVDKVVFNQIPIATAIQRLADLLNYRWYVDENKSVHLFEKTQEKAPQDITDTSGNYIYKSLRRTASGSQLINRIKIRGGEYDGEIYTDSITVSGNATKSFNLPYKVSDLSVSLNGVAQDVGVDNINDFTNYDVLYNYQNQSFRFETALADGDIIEFSGRPKIRVFAIAEDTDSVEAYGVQEKMIRENDIRSNKIARKRASAELYAYAQPLIDAQFETYNKFLELGMNINVQSNASGADDTLIISRIDYRLIDAETFMYKVELVSNKRMDLISMLAKILQPDELDIDEAETSEEIYADNAEMGIEEDITVVNPIEDFDSFEVQEDILIDPVAPEDIEWIFGYYHPTSDTDPKRMAKFDRTAKFV